MLPLGLVATSLDPQLVSALDDFGSIRGAAARTTVVGQTTDPRSEFRLVEALIPLLEALDESLSRL